MKWLIYFFILILTLLSFGCHAHMEGLVLAATSPPRCPEPPSVAWMVPEIEGQPDQLSDRRMSVQGTYAPKAEITGFHYKPEDCWIAAGLPLDTLTEAVSTALAHARLVQFIASPEGKYMLQFEVERQRLTSKFHRLGLGSLTATVVVSYSVLVSDSKALIWKEEITGEHMIEFGFAAPRRNYGSKSEATAIEGAVATNLSVLIGKLKDLPLDKD